MQFGFGVAQVCEHAEVALYQPSQTLLLSDNGLSYLNYSESDTENLLLLSYIPYFCDCSGIQ